jgi:hypothetical protein
MRLLFIAPRARCVANVTGIGSVSISLEAAIVLQHQSGSARLSALCSLPALQDLAPIWRPYWP